MSETGQLLSTRLYVIFCHAAEVVRVDYFKYSSVPLTDLLLIAYVPSV